MSRRSRFSKEMMRLTRAVSQRPQLDGHAGLSDREPSAAPDGPGVMIFRSEMEFISSCILDFPQTETGGQLFGYWAEDGTPVVLYAIGPGRAANHQGTFFNQDMGYLVEMGGALHERYGLHHIGEWHSHHMLGLARPSGHDVHTMVSTIRERRLGRFLLCIGNCRGSGSTLNPFMCDSDGCTGSSWNMIMADSPVRDMIDHDLRDSIVLPHHQPKCVDRVMEPSTQAVVFPDGYWLETRRGREEFNSFIQDLKVNHSGGVYSVAPKIDAAGIAHIVVKARRAGETAVIDIAFPEGFPDRRAPEVRMTLGGHPAGCTCPEWDRNADPRPAFMKFFCRIKPCNI